MQEEPFNDLKMGQNLIKKFESWPDKIKPPFSTIKIIGCCDEHELSGDFRWYREHTWQEFKALILNPKINIGHVIDEAQFGSLNPSVKRYFLKGVLSALVYLLSQKKDFGALTICEAWGWICPYDKKLIDDLDKIKKESLVFSKEEIKDILELLELISDKFLIYTPDEEEMERALGFWKKLLEIMSH